MKNYRTDPLAYGVGYAMVRNIAVSEDLYPKANLFLEARDAVLYALKVGVHEHDANFFYKALRNEVRVIETCSPSICLFTTGTLRQMIECCSGFSTYFRSHALRLMTTASGGRIQDYSQVSILNAMDDLQWDVILAHDNPFDFLPNTQQTTEETK